MMASLMSTLRRGRSIVSLRTMRVTIIQTIRAQHTDDAGGVFYDFDFGSGFFHLLSLIHCCSKRAHSIQYRCDPC